MSTITCYYFCPVLFAHKPRTSFKFALWCKTHFTELLSQSHKHFTQSHTRACCDFSLSQLFLSGSSYTNIFSLNYFSKLTLSHIFTSIFTKLRNLARAGVTDTFSLTFARFLFLARFFPFLRFSFFRRTCRRAKTQNTRSIFRLTLTKTVFGFSQIARILPTFRKKLTFFLNFADHCTNICKRGTRHGYVGNSAGQPGIYQAFTRYFYRQSA